MKDTTPRLKIKERRRSPYIVQEPEPARAGRNFSWVEDNAVIVAARKAHYLKALKASLACVADACRMTGVSRSTFYRWMKTDAAFRDYVENVIEPDAVEMVEAVFLRQIFEHGDVKAMIFFLSRRGKCRGWS